MNMLSWWLTAELLNYSDAALLLYYRYADVSSLHNPVFPLLHNSVNVAILQRRALEFNQLHFHLLCLQIPSKDKSEQPPVNSSLSSFNVVQRLNGTVLRGCVCAFLICAVFLLFDRRTNLLATLSEGHRIFQTCWSRLTKPGHVQNMPSSLLLTLQTESLDTIYF